MPTQNVRKRVAKKTAQPDPKAAAVAAVEAEIAAAAELEGLAPMPEDLIALRAEKLLIDQEKDKLEARLREIKDTFGDRLTADGLQGYILNGKVKARRSPGTRTSVDGKRLKEELPHIYQNFLKTTPYVSINIS
jgi:predicted phage-related endonuclease